jgi:hypothetical protein
VDDASPQGVRKPASADAGRGPAGQPGVIGIALAAALTAALAQGSWEWWATYIGVTLLAVVFSFYRLPTWTPRLGSEYVRNLAAYSLVVGLCVAIVLAPMLQRWAWLYPMPGTRSECRGLGRYEGLRVEASLGNLAGRDGAALAQAQDIQRHTVVADCLATTTTLWLPVFGAGAAVLVGLGAWSLDRARVRREPAVVTRSPRQPG